jgi:kynurenine formamidase
MSKIRVIDLSVSTENSPSEIFPVEVIHEPHSQSADILAMVYGCQKGDLYQGLGPADDMVKLKSHAGTHMDAPWHYFPTSEGKKARTIDEIPLEWFFGNGVVLDMRHKPEGSGIVTDDVKQALTKIKYEIKPWDIVLIQTGADKYWGKPEYGGRGCAMTAESTSWLIDQGVKVMGIDAWGWDRPASVIREEFKRTGDKNIILEAHRVGIEKEYCHMEKMANLDQLPKPFGFTVACFPVKLTGGSAGWCRAVAIISK